MDPKFYGFKVKGNEGTRPTNMVHLSKSQSPIFNQEQLQNNYWKRQNAAQAEHIHAIHAGSYEPKHCNDIYDQSDDQASMNSMACNVDSSVSGSDVQSTVHRQITIKWLKTLGLEWYCDALMKCGADYNTLLDLGEHDIRKEIENVMPSKDVDTIISSIRQLSQQNQQQSKHTPINYPHNPPKAKQARAPNNYQPIKAHSNSNLRAHNYPKFASQQSVSPNNNYSSYSHSTKSGSKCTPLSSNIHDNYHKSSKIKSNVSQRGRSNQSAVSSIGRQVQPSQTSQLSEDVVKTQNLLRKIGLFHFWKPLTDEGFDVGCLSILEEEDIKETLLKIVLEPSLQKILEYKKECESKENQENQENKHIGLKNAESTSKSKSPSQWSQQLQSPSRSQSQYRAPNANNNAELISRSQSLSSSKSTQQKRKWYWLMKGGRTAWLPYEQEEQNSLDFYWKEFEVTDYRQHYASRKVNIKGQERMITFSKPNKSGGQFLNATQSTGKPGITRQVVCGTPDKNDEIRGIITLE